MTYQNFVQELCKETKEKFHGEYLIEIKEVLKYNDSKKYHMQIRKNETETLLKAVPSIDLEPFFEMYQEGKSIPECAERLLWIFKESEKEENPEQELKLLQSWEAMKTHVYPVLLSQAKNQELLKTLVWTPFLDFAVCYVAACSFQGRQGYVKIKEKHLAMWGIEKEELVCTAQKNNQMQEYEWKSMQAMIAELMGITEESVSGIAQGEGMYILTNQDRVYGAAKLLDTELLKKILGGKDFYIIPSSLHEIILVSAETKMGRAELDVMVREVNANQVEKEEQLSDHVYFYNGRTGMVEM